MCKFVKGMAWQNLIRNRGMSWIGNSERGTKFPKLWRSLKGLIPGPGGTEKGRLPKKLQGWERERLIERRQLICNWHSFLTKSAHFTGTSHSSVECDLEFNCWVVIATVTLRLRHVPWLPTAHGMGKRNMWRRNSSFSFYNGNEGKSGISEMYSEIFWSDSFYEVTHFMKLFYVTWS